MEIKNKRIVVTGATSGIGLELVKALSAFPGTSIVASGRRIENIPETGNIFPFKADVSQPAGVDALFRFAVEKLGGIDIFIANAGFAYYEKFRLADWEHVNNIFATNVVSPLYSVAKMIELNPQNEFTVLVTCSAIGKLPYPRFALYTGTKFALDGFNSAMQVEMPRNGHLSMIYPVATYTGFFDRAEMQKNQMPRPRQHADKVVKAVINGIQKNRKKIYPFVPLRFLVYLSHLFPFLMNIYLKLQAKKLKD